jgi:thiol:disulfide interchange protein DsbC
MQIKTFLAFFLFFTMGALPVQAEDVTMGETLKQELVKVFGGEPDRVTQAPLEGMLEVTYGAKLFYVTRDGRFLINGEMFDLATRTNLTEQQLSRARLNTLDAIDESSMIVYRAKGEEKHVITVFTDIDCVYCRKLHKGMEQMNELGITVRYMAYPRAGLNSPSYDKAVSVWCADNRNQALDDAKNRGKVSQKRCEDSPVKQQMATGEQMGVTGTPAIILDDGRMMPGYAPPRKLAALMERSAN